MSNERELPRYQSHKVVHALKVNQYRSTMDNGMMLYFEHDGFDPIEIPESEVTPFLQMAGDDQGYLVIYADGYRSWSPTKAFEEGYTRL